MPDHSKGPRSDRRVVRLSADLTMARVRNREQRPDLIRDSVLRADLHALPIKGPARRVRGHARRSNPGCSLVNAHRNHRHHAPRAVLHVPARPGSGRHTRVSPVSAHHPRVKGANVHRIRASLASVRLSRANARQDKDLLHKTVRGRDRRVARVEDPVREMRPPSVPASLMRTTGAFRMVHRVARGSRTRAIAAVPVVNANLCSPLWASLWWGNPYRSKIWQRPWVWRPVRSFAD